MKYVIRLFIASILCSFFSISNAYRICICFHGQGEKIILDPSIGKIPEVKKIFLTIKKLTGIDIRNELDGRTLPQNKAQIALVAIEVSILELLRKENILNKCFLYMGQSHRTRCDASSVKNSGHSVPLRGPCTIPLSVQSNTL